MIRYFITSSIGIISFYLFKLPFCPNIFGEISAARAVGYGTQAYRDKDYARAFKALKPISDYSIADPYVGSAQYLVGLMYKYGLGVSKDTMLAQHYFRSAIERKNKDAEKEITK